MTRKDYILIARALGCAHGQVYCKEENSYQGGVRCAAMHIALGLKEDNPNFDREHFLAVVRGEKALTSRPPRV